MKKTTTSLAVLALGTGLVAGGFTTADAAQSKTTKVETTVNLSPNYTFGEEDGTVTIHGYVKGTGCKKSRKITVRQTDQKADVGTTKTDSKGKWSVTFNGNEIEPGTFKAVALRAEHGKLICLSGSDTTVIGG